MRYFSACLFLLIASGSTQAAVVYDLFYRVGGVDSYNRVINVAPDSVIGGVEIVLRETRTAGEDNLLGVGGLRGLALDIRSTPGDQFDALARNPNFQLDGSGADRDTISAFNFAGGVAGTDDPIIPNASNLVLGTIDLRAPSEGGSTVFTLADADLANPNFNLSTGPIDGLLTPQTLTLSAVTAVPEPSALFALGMMATGVVMRRRRRA